MAEGEVPAVPPSAAALVAGGRPALPVAHHWSAPRPTPPSAACSTASPLRRPRSSFRSTCSSRPSPRCSRVWCTSWACRSGAPGVGGVRVLEVAEVPGKGPVQMAMRLLPGHALMPRPPTGPPSPPHRRRFALVPLGPPLLTYSSTSKVGGWRGGGCGAPASAPRAWLPRAIGQSKTFNKKHPSVQAMLKYDPASREVQLAVDRPYVPGEPLLAWCGPQVRAGGAAGRGCTCSSCFPGRCRR